MTDAQIYAGTLTASQNERTATGLLVPFGEECSSNLGRFQVDSGAFTVPADLTGIGLNVEHEREQVVGAVTALHPTEQGVVATFTFSSTPEGEQALSDARNGRRRNLSAEVAGVVIKDGKAIAGRIFGAALVKAGAFPSATLLASAPDTDLEAAEDPKEFTDEHGVTWRRVEDIDQTTDTTEPAPADEEPEPADEQADTEKEAPVGAATIPSTLTATTTAAPEQPSINRVFDLITRARKGDGEAGTLLAALSDIKTSGTGALASSGVLQPAWLGELWTGRAYQRKYMPLIRNGNIVAIDEKGFILSGTQDLVQPWAGNKVELPTGTATTTVASSTFQRWGYAADIAREFFDIPGNNDVIEAFVRRLAESYAKATDEWTLDQIVAASTTVAPDTYPTDYPGALGQLIQGIEAVEDAGDSATFAIANAAAWTELLYTPRDQVPEFISFRFGINGEGAAGTVPVVKGDIGIDDTAAVLVGSRAAAHVNELPGASPLNIDALDIAHGGIDKAVIGYTQFLADFPDALVIVGTADAA